MLIIERVRKGTIEDPSIVIETFLFIFRLADLFLTLTQGPISIIEVKSASSGFREDKAKKEKIELTEPIEGYIAVSIHFKVTQIFVFYINSISSISGISRVLLCLEEISN